jgi:SAM-dependent methyltransferase
LLERARIRAAAEGLHIDFQEGDATALPFPDASFDVVMSTFGAIFAPDPEKTAYEMARVCRPGGKVAMANWTPEGMLGTLFRILANYSPDSAQRDAPVLWGDEGILRTRLQPYVTDLRMERKTMRFRSRSPAHWVEFMRTQFGPAILAFEHSSPSEKEALEREMLDLMHRFNRSPNGTALGESEYIEVVATRV